MTISKNYGTALKCIKSSRVKIFRRGWVLLIFPRADADGIERKIVNSGILCCLPENFDEREVGLNAQRRFDEICPECHFPSSHLFLNNISSQFQKYWLSRVRLCSHY